MSRSLILVVDDEPAMVRYVESVLQAAGYAVINARCGAEALTLLEDERPDLIMLDRMVPGIDGPATLRRFRTIRHRAPILLFADRGDEKLEAWQSEVDGTIMPPLHPDKLVARVGEMLCPSGEDHAGGRPLPRSHRIDIDLGQYGEEAAGYE